MKIEKIELRHLKGYLDTGLKFISELDKPYNEFGKQPIWTWNGISFLFGDYCLNPLEISDAYPLHLCKPILRNLSDLTKEIEVNGEKFVPIDELSHYAIQQTDNGINGLEWNIVSTFPYRDIQKLYEWHFDLHSLIENNLAIDINTLEK